MIESSNPAKKAKNGLPQDRFDLVPKRLPRGAKIGAHRRVPQRNFFWRWLLWMIIMVVIFSVVGIFILARTNTGGKIEQAIAKRASQVQPNLGQSGDKNAQNKPQAAQQPQNPAPQPAPTVPEEPKINKEANIAVYNAAAKAGLAGRVREYITNQSLGKVLRADTAQSLQKKTTVFYFQEADKKDAEALAKKLTGATASFDTTKQWESDGVDLVVVVGSDYTGPGAVQ